MALSLTDKHRELVTESFARLIPVSAAATTVFYNHLWEIAPETKALFHDTDMAQQGMKLMQTLGITVRALHEPETIAPMLNDLGKRHVGYGVTRDQFEPVRSALLRMVEQSLGDDFTPEVREAWNAAYDIIAAMTLHGYE